MIAELQAERQRIDEAIQALERLSAGNARRRGRPPGWLKGETEPHSSADVENVEDAPPKAKKASQT